jgi:hypothetical protein
MVKWRPPESVYTYFVWTRLLSDTTDCLELSSLTLASACSPSVVGGTGTGSLDLPHDNNTAANSTTAPNTTVLGTTNSSPIFDLKTLGTDCD